MNKETKKKLNKKMNLKARLATIGLVGGLAATSLTACSDVEAVKDPVEITSEVVEEPIATGEPVVEQPTEQPTEEPVIEVDPYSTEGITALCDELFEKYGEDIPADQITALVIAINYDHISAEDLDELCSIYGCSLEDIDNSIDEFCLSIVDVSKNLRRIEFGDGNGDIELYKSRKNSKVNFSEFVVDNEYKEIIGDLNEIFKGYNMNASLYDELLERVFAGDLNFNSEEKMALLMYTAAVADTKDNPKEYLNGEREYYGIIFSDKAKTK